MKKSPFVIITACLVAWLTACAAADSDAPLTGILFDRGNSSTWGTQFYIEVHADQIVLARYFPEGAREQTTCRQIPISQEQWDTLCTMVQSLELQKARSSLWQSLWKDRKLDGGEYRKLTLSRQTEKGTVQTQYRWPDSDQARALEAFLEAMVSSCEEDAP